MPKSIIICYHIVMNRLKRILAIICIIILIGMYVTTLVMAIFDNPSTMSMFKGCIACTIFVPVVAYGYICLHRYAMNRSKREDSYSLGSSGGDSASSDDTTE